jgi:hypothetical protein
VARDRLDAVRVPPLPTSVASDEMMVRQAAVTVRAFLKIVMARGEMYRDGIACLPESVAVCAALRRLGFVDAQVVIGVSNWERLSEDSPRPGHAWVQVGANELTESVEVQASYLVVDRFPASGRPAGAAIGALA